MFFAGMPNVSLMNDIMVLSFEFFSKEKDIFFGVLNLINSSG